MTTPPPTQAELEAAAAIITCYMPQLEFRSQKNIAQIIAAHRAEPPAESALQASCQELIAYRDRVGALNFQLEKADDFINLIRYALDGLPADPAQAHAAELENLLARLVPAIYAQGVDAKLSELMAEIRTLFATLDAERKAQKVSTP